MNISNVKWGFKFKAETCVTVYIPYLLDIQRAGFRASYYREDREQISGDQLEITDGDWIVHVWFHKGSEEIEFTCRNVNGLKHPYFQGRRNEDYASGRRLASFCRMIAMNRKGETK